MTRAFWRWLSQLGAGIEFAAGVLAWTVLFGVFLLLGVGFGFVARVVWDGWK